MTPSFLQALHVGIARTPIGLRVIFVQIDGEAYATYDPPGARDLAAELRASFGPDEPIAADLDRFAAQLEDGK
jgi:hypothetical protein